MKKRIIKRWDTNTPDTVGQPAVKMDKLCPIVFAEAAELLGQELTSVDVDYYLLAEDFIKKHAVGERDTHVYLDVSKGLSMGRGVEGETIFLEEVTDV